MNAGMAAFAAINRDKLFKSEPSRTPAQGKSLLSPSGPTGMPKIKKKKKRLVDSPAPASNGYSRTLG